MPVRDYSLSEVAGMLEEMPTLDQRKEKEDGRG